ncbi:MAG: MFS transporter [Candidatus Binataceae bacterium]
MIERAADSEPESSNHLDSAAPATRLGAFRALHYRNFRLFFGGQLTSLIGTWMQQVAQGWLVLKLTNSAWMLGVVAFATFAPIFLFALFAGVVVDHVDRRRLIMCTQTILMLDAFALAILTFTGVVRVEDVIILAAINGVVSAFDMPGRQTFLVEMVGGRADLPNAIALNSMLVNGARALGPAIAGLLIAVIGLSGCFFLNGLSYIAVILSLYAMDVPRREGMRFGSVMWLRLREGVTYVWRHRPSFYLMVLVAITSGFAFQYSVLIPLFAQDVLHRGAQAYGFLLGAQGFGAVLGAAVMASTSSQPRALRLNLIFGVFAMAIAIAVFGLSPLYGLSIGAQMVIGAGMMNYMAATNTLVQLFVTDELRGRVMSIYTMSFIGLAPIGSLEVGFTGAHLGPRSATLICAAVGLGCALFLLTKLKLLAEGQLAREQTA